jgi:hypothetical protein
MAGTYTNNVFINCPFDDLYLPIRKAIVFAIFDCGFVPRCALEIDDSGEMRFDKIKRLIDESKFGVHDISRTEIDPDTNLPRFNMTLELGVFIGAKHFGNRNQKHKNCLILDTEKYRFQKFISDIAGQDIRDHSNDPARAITHVRNWLNSASGRKTIPGGSEILRRFNQFEVDLPDICASIPIRLDELTYNDYANFVSEWLGGN